MAEYRATIEWERQGAVFVDNRYGRGHDWEFDGGIRVRGSASPQVVPLPFSEENAVDPEEAFVAALSSCHMLWFLSIAAKRKYLVEHYRDEAVGTLGRNAEGRLAMLEVILRPVVTFGAGAAPDESAEQRMHEEAHQQCFIASSVKTVVRCEPSARSQRLTSTGPG